MAQRQVGHHARIQGERFRLKESGVDEFLRSVRVKNAMVAEAELLKETIVAEGPDARSNRRGFVASIRRTPVEVTGDVVKATVYSTDIAAHLIEYGSVNNIAYAPFRRAAAALGLELRGGRE